MYNNPFGAIPVPPPPIGLIIAPQRQPQQPQGIFGSPQPLKQECVPLKNISVKAQLTGYVVALDSVLSYCNEGSDPVEVLFRFPIDEAYAVTGLEAVLGGRRIKAAIKEKDEAKQEYDDAIASGFTAALGEEKTRDIFSISLGNLPPKSEAEVHLQLVGELPLDAEGAVLFTLPSVLKHRYTPVGSTDPLQPVSAPMESTQPATVPAVFNFSMEIMHPHTISTVTSATHSISTTADEEKISVSLGEPKPLVKDLVISVTHVNPHTPTAIGESGNGAKSQRKFMGSPAVMLNFFPEFDTKRAACEFIFVIDRSGSMRGSFMKSAKETLKLFLQSIPPGCHFNIIGFGSSYKVVFGWSEEYNQHSLGRAIAETDKMFANLGGTELLEPLKYIYSQPLLPGLPRQVFVLTDGSVSNTNACIQEVKKHVAHTRVFTFGIGSGASTELVRGLARAGNGTAEFVHEGERMQPKVIASLKRALQPAVTDINVTFTVPSGFDVVQAPAKIPVLFSGDKTTVFGIFKSKALSDDPLQMPLSGSAILKGNVVGKPIEHHIQFTVPEPSLMSTTTATPVIHQLAAKALIQDMQSEDKHKNEVIDLSIQSSVISSHTAYIAVDEEQDKPIEGAVKVWDVLAYATQARQPTGLVSFGGLGGPPPAMAAAPMSSYSNTSSFGAFDMLAGGPPPPPSGGIFLSQGPPAPMQRMMGGPPPSHSGIVHSDLLDLDLSAPTPSTGGLFGGPPTSGGLISLPQGPPPRPMGATRNTATTGGLFGASAAGSDDLLGGIGTSGGTGSLVFGQSSSSSPMGGVVTDSASLIQRGPSSARAKNSLGDTSQAFNFAGSSGGLIDLRSGSGLGSTYGSGFRGSASTSSGSYDTLAKVLSLQKAEGYWELEQAGSEILHLSLGELTDKVPVSCVPSVWATVLVLAYLELKFAAQKDEWELVAMKAEMWLEKEVDQERLTKLKEAAKTCI